tara:strand:+ start:1075 stop:1203 length:129 start_codon:yes stop_codon:yes gene_type:complete
MNDNKIIVIKSKKLGWKPMISFERLVEDMVTSDLQVIKRYLI